MRYPADIDVDMDDCEEEAVDLIVVDIPAWQRNTPSPLATELPLEVLVYIFLFVVDTEFRAIWRQLIRLAGVCKHWREAMLRAPTLWHHIDMDNFTRPEMVEEMVKRSQKVPLQLNLWFRDDSNHLVDVPLITPVLDRVETLSILLMEVPEYDIPTFNMPNLRRLDITTTPGCLPPFISPDSSLPHLRAFKMCDLNFIEAIPFFRPTIRRLSVMYDMPDSGSPTMDELMSALREMPLLESLSLNAVFYDIYTPSTDLRPVVLVHLQELKIRDFAPAVVGILEQLVFPSAVLFSFDETKTEITFGIPSEDPDVATTSQHFIALCKALGVKLSGNGLIGSLPVVDKMRVIFDRVDDAGSLTLEAHNTSSGVAFRCRVVTMMGPVPVVTSIASTLPKGVLAGIRELDVVVDNTGTMFAHRSDVPFSSISNFSSLTSLSINGSQRLIRQLAAMYPTLDTLWNRTAEDVQPLLPLPALRTLTLVKPTFLRKDLVPIEDGPVSRIRDMLACHWWAGSPLNAVTFKNPGSATESDMEMFRQFVEVVVWEKNI